MLIIKNTFSKKTTIAALTLFAFVSLFALMQQWKASAETTIGTGDWTAGRTATTYRGCWPGRSIGLGSDCDLKKGKDTNYSAYGTPTGTKTCTSSFDANKNGNTDDLVDHDNNSGTPAISNSGLILNCDTGTWGSAPLPGCTAENYGKDCTYSNCNASTGRGTKTCSLNDGVQCSGGVGNGSTYTHPGIFDCPACSASQETCGYQYNCTGKSTNGITGGKKRNVCTSSTCNPTQNVEEDCSVCSDDIYTNCGWPATCSSSEFAAGKVVKQCKVPDSSQCKPTNSGSPQFVEDATRQKEKSCCRKDVADPSSPTHYSKSYSSCTVPTCNSSKIKTTCSSAASGISCIPEPTPLTITIASSCKDCTVGITDDGVTKGAYTNNCSVVPLSSGSVAACNTGTNKYTLRCGATDITCSESTHDFHPTCIDCLAATATDASTTNAGASKGTYTQCVAGNSCGVDNKYELTCTSTDGRCRDASHIFKPDCPNCTYNTGSSCVDQKECDPTTNSPESKKTTWKCAKASDNQSYCKGANEISEQRDCGLCVEDDLYTCPWSDCRDGVKTRTCTKKSGLRKGAPNCVLPSDCSDADCSNKYGKSDTTSVGCGGAPPDSGLPTGTTGSTMINIGGSWIGSPFLFHKYVGSDKRIGIGTVSPSGTLEISDASNTIPTTQLRITDYNDNPELQLQYGIDSGFEQIKHWSLYVKNVKATGETTGPDKSLRIWGFGQDRVIIDKDGYVHAAKYCTNMDTDECTELTSGSGDLPAAGSVGNLLRSNGTDWTSWTPTYISNPTGGTSGQYLQLTDSGAATWATVSDRVGTLSVGSIPKWDTDTLKDSLLIESGGKIGIGTPKPSMLLTIAGAAQNLDGDKCPAGTEWIDENGNTTKDNGECKPTIALNPEGGTLRITKNAVAGRVLVSDGNGNGTWQDFSSLLTGTQGQTLWWNEGVWASTSKLTINQNGSVGIGAVTPAEFETSRFAVKSDDTTKKNGMFVSLQGSDTIISTTAPPSAWAIIVSFAGLTDALKIDGKKLTITYYVQNAGEKPLYDVAVTDTICNSKGNIGTPTKKNGGDDNNSGVLDAGVYAGDGSGKSTSAETWTFQCVIEDVTTKMTDGKVIGTATVTAKKTSGGEAITPGVAYWKAEKRIMGRSGPAPASAVAQPAAQPESAASTIVPAAPAGAGSLAPAAPTGPTPAWGGAQ